MEKVTESFFLALLCLCVCVCVRCIKCLLQLLEKPFL